MVVQRDGRALEKARVLVRHMGEDGAVEVHGGMVS